MATLLTLRRRIKTAQNVSKTTRAMQMIAASKLKKAQEATLTARPYVNKLVELTHSVAPSNDNQSDVLHPYMEIKKSSGKSLYLVISPDKGLCGALITNLMREYLKYKNPQSEFIVIGKKLEGIVAGTNHLIASFPFGNTLPSFETVLPIIDIIDEYFLGNKVDNVKIITTHFNSVFLQAPVVINLLPIKLEDISEKTLTNERLFEPIASELLPPLLRRYIEMVVYQQLLESYVSEWAARMLAMQNATNNAKDLVNQLRLIYNKARQERITKEILDISSAALGMEQE